MESLILFACGLWNAMWPCRRGRRRQSASRRCVIEWDRDCGWAMDTFFVALFVLPLCGVRHWIAECFSMLIVDVFSRGNDYIIRWLMRRVRFVTDSRVVHVNRWMSLWVAHKRWCTYTYMWWWGTIGRSPDFGRHSNWDESENYWIEVNLDRFFFRFFISFHFGHIQIAYIIHTGQLRHLFVISLMAFARASLVVHRM